MNNLFDSPAIDLLSYGQDDQMGDNAYFWQVDDYQWHDYQSTTDESAFDA